MESPLAEFPTHYSQQARMRYLMIRALWNGTVIAESDDTVVVEGNHYFPLSDVHQQVLVASTTTTTCPWKGQANYYSLEVDGQVNSDAAWYYPHPSAAASSVEGRIAFWKGVQIEDATGDKHRRPILDHFRRSTPDEGPVAPERVIDADEASFPSVTAGSVAIIDFWAPWCGPCKALHPVFQALADGHSDNGVLFVRVNVDESPDLAAAFNVMSIPTLVLLDNGNEVDRESGLPARKRLDQLVTAADALVGAHEGQGAA